MAFNLSMDPKKFITDLLDKNKKMLLKEIKQSKELMTLIGKSATQDLTEEEKDKVKSQLLDIFKSVPALAIFLLPGGAILLPIAIKYIPNLMPSSFYEDDEEE